MVELIDESISIATADFAAERQADLPSWRAEQYERIINNLQALRRDAEGGALRLSKDPKRVGNLGFTRFAEEAGPLSDTLWKSFGALERYYRENL